MEIFISLIIGGLVVLGITTYVKHLKNKKKVFSEKRKKNSRYHKIKNFKIIKEAVFRDKRDP